MCPSGNCAERHSNPFGFAPFFNAFWLAGLTRRCGFIHSGAPAAAHGLAGAGSLPSIKYRAPAHRECRAGAYLIKGGGNGCVIFAIIFAIVVATIILAVFAPLLITIFSAIAAVTGIFTAAAISVILSGLALWISAEKKSQ